MEGENYEDVWAEESNASDSCVDLKSDHKKAVIKWVVLGCGSFSFVCCLLVLATIAVFKKVRTTSQRLVLYLVLVTFAMSAVYVLHGVEDKGKLKGSGAYCMLTAFLDQVLSWMELLAMLCLTVDIFTKVRTMDFQVTKKYELFYIFAIFVLPLTFNWIPFTTSAYDDSGPYCWIRTCKKISNDNNTTTDNTTYKYVEDKYGVAFQFALFWIPFYTTILVIILIYGWSIYRARVRLKQYQATYDPNSKIMREQLISELWQYMLYPLIVIIVNTVPLISRLVNAIAINEEFFELQILHGVFVNLEGPGLALVFFTNSETRKDLGSYQTIKLALVAFFCCWRQTRVKAYPYIVERETDSLIKSNSDSYPKKDQPQRYNAIVSDEISTTFT